MHGPFVCAVFAICFNLQLVVGQCTGCGCEVGSQNVIQSAKDDSPLEGCNEPFVPLWLDIGKLDVDGIANNVAKWVQNTWNSRVKLKLSFHKNEQNDSLVNKPFRDSGSATDNEVGRTFGIRRRMQLFLWLPISFKLGIIVTLLLVLAAMSLKTLIIGFVILLLLLHYTHSHANLWGPAKIHKLSESHKNIHIHVHPLPEDHRSYSQSWHEPSQPVVYSA